MIRWILQKTIPHYTQVQDPAVRKSYGVLAGVLGIICNALLFFIKLIAGVLLHSIAVISDAFNNLSDMAASVVALLGAKLSGRGADEGHPYGHGRGEYIAALIVAFFIIFVGLQLFLRGVGQILHPSPVALGLLPMLFLAFSVLLKLWMFSYNRYLGSAIDSKLLFAAAKDSLNDVAATGAVLLCALLAPICPFPPDGIVGLAVSCLVLYTGYSVAKDTIDRLLGQKPAEGLQKQIESMILGNPNVLGMHDLMVHDYGPGRIIASAHAEVPDHLTLIACHDIIDCIEKEILAALGVDIVIHMDPVPMRRHQLPPK